MRFAPVFLVILGLARMVGDLTQLVPLEAAAAATGASPAPKFFAGSPYAQTYVLDLGNERVELTPALFARIDGPSERRSVVVNAIAYAPVLPASLRDPVLRYGFCGEAPLLREMELRAAATPAIELEGAADRELQARFEVPCR